MDGRTAKTDHRQKSDAKRSDSHTHVRSSGSDETTRRIEHDIKNAARHDARLSTHQKAGIRGSGSDTSRRDGSAHSAGGSTQMKGIYIFLFTGIILSFILTLAAIVALFYPTGVSPNDSIKAIPIDASAGSLMSYKINGCEEGKHTGTTSVNIQSIDTPPSITVAVAAPSPQAVHCQNALLIPQPLPTGDYKIIVYIRYHINPIRDLLLPVERKYTSNTIHITNPNPNFVLPTAKVNADKPTAQDATAEQSYETKGATTTPTESDSTEPSAIKQTVNATTDSIKDVTNPLLGGK